MRLHICDIFMEDNFNGPTFRYFMPSFKSYQDIQILTKWYSFFGSTHSCDIFEIDSSHYLPPLFWTYCVGDCASVSSIINGIGLECRWLLANWQRQVLQLSDNLSIIISCLYQKVLDLRSRHSFDVVINIFETGLIRIILGLQVRRQFHQHIVCINSIILIISLKVSWSQFYCPITSHFNIFWKGCWKILILRSWGLSGIQKNSICLLINRKHISISINIIYSHGNGYRVKMISWIKHFEYVNGNKSSWISWARI